MFDRKLIFNRVMLSTWFTNGMVMMGFVVIMPFIPLYVQELGASDPASAVLWSGAIFSAFGVAAFVTAPLMGNLADRIGPKPVLVWGFAVASLIFLLMGVVSSLHLLVVLRFLQGLLGAGAPAATSTVVANSVPQRQMGQAFGFFQTSITIASGVGPLVGGIIADSVGLREAFFVAAAFMFTGVLVALFFIPNTRYRFQGRRPGPIEELRQVVNTPALFNIWLAALVMQVSILFVMPIFPLFLQEMGVGQVATTMGVLMAVNAVASTLATPASGVLADRRGHRAVLVASLWGSGLLAAATAAVSNVGQLLVVRVLAGVVGAGIGPTTSALVTEATGGHQRGSAFGLLSTARTVGVVIGPLLGGAIVHLAGLRGAFVGTGILMLLVAAWIGVAMRAPREKRGEKLL